MAIFDGFSCGARKAWVWAISVVPLNDHLHRTWPLGAEVFPARLLCETTGHPTVLHVFREAGRPLAGPNAAGTTLSASLHKEGHENQASGGISPDRSQRRLLREGVPRFSRRPSTKQGIARYQYPRSRSIGLFRQGGRSRFSCDLVFDASGDEPAYASVAGKSESKGIVVIGAHYNDHEGSATYNNQEGTAEREPR